MEIKELWELTICYASYLDVEFFVGSMKIKKYSCFQLLPIIDQTKTTNLILNSLLFISI